MSKSSIMAIAAHCDDIELCFGSTLAKYYHSEKYQIHYVMSTNNMSGGWSQALRGDQVGKAPMPDWITEKSTVERPDRLIHRVPWYHEMAQRKKEAAAAAACFGAVPIHLDYAQRHYTDRNINTVELRYGAPVPDCYDPSIPTIMTACEDKDAIRRVADLILEKNPEVIFTHPAVDYTFEHTGTSLLVQKAFAQATERGYDGSLLFRSTPPALKQMGRFFERWDSFVDTTGFLPHKYESLAKHACQIPFPERMDFFDKFAGELCGCETVETYVAVELSETRSGRLTEELTRNHEYCISNWAELFFSEKAKRLFDAFEDQVRLNNDLPPRKK